MKTIGLLGGMSWESTVSYYRIINEAIRARRGGLHSAQCVLYSVDFAEIEALQQAGRWEEAGQRLLEAARSLERAGADLLLLCTNTMHIVADTLQVGIRIPMLHIADATAEHIRRAGHRRLGLLGTHFTMEQDFYAGRLRRHFGLDVLVPPPGERETVHRIIFDELCRGEMRPESRTALSGILERLALQGAEGIILGCTELGLILTNGDSPVPLFDTTRIHALAAVDLALASEAALAGG